MKDIVINSKRIWIETIAILLSLIGAVGMNVHAIIKHKTQWSELYTEWFLTLILAVILYALFILLRLLLKGIFFLCKVVLKKKEKE